MHVDVTFRRDYEVSTVLLKARRPHTGSGRNQ
jgi:hypothetical protein